MFRVTTLQYPHMLEACGMCVPSTCCRGGCVRGYLRPVETVCIVRLHQAGWQLADKPVAVCIHKASRLETGPVGQYAGEGQAALDVPDDACHRRSRHLNPAQAHAQRCRSVCCH